MQKLALLALVCLVSVAMTGLCGSLLPVPQSDLFYERMMQRKLHRARSLGDAPKLVILAGSNGLYSHSCRVMEPIIHRPCVNASMTVDVGLDWVLARWAPLLHADDIVYMPIEPPLYTRTRAENRITPDSRIMLHDDWRSLLSLGPDRIVAALLCVNLPSELWMKLVESTQQQRQAEVDQTLDQRFDDWGDRFGHMISHTAHEDEFTPRAAPSAPEITNGAGTRLIGRFVRWAASHGVIVVGGYATEIEADAMPDASAAAIQAAFTDAGGRFLELPSRARYPRSEFFDTRYHLNETGQAAHSIRIAAALESLLRR